MGLSLGLKEYILVKSLAPSKYDINVTAVTVAPANTVTPASPAA